MKTNKTKKLEFKKTNIVELNSDKLRTIVGGSTTGLGLETDPKTIYTTILCNHVNLKF
jgi:natural product precursor